MCLIDIALLKESSIGKVNFLSCVFLDIVRDINIKGIVYTPA